MVDLAHPVEVRVYLPGCSSSGARTVRTIARTAGEQAVLVERETIAQIVKATLESLRNEGTPIAPTCAVTHGKQDSSAGG